MKKIFIALLIAAASTSAIARAEIHADEGIISPGYEYDEILLNDRNDFQLNTGGKQKLYDKDNLNFDKNLDVKQNRYYANDNVKKGNVSYTYSKKKGNSTYGTKYENTLAPDDVAQSATLFKKYEKNKFSIDTSYQNKQSTLGANGSGSVAVAPEYKINKHLSIKGVLSSDVQQDKKKNEVVFSIKPTKDDRMNLDLGAGQSYNGETGVTGSRLNFSTKLRF